MSRVVPSGSPSWTRTADFTNYGGDLHKQDFLNRGPIDSLTDVGAASFARMTNDLAAAVRTAPLAVITFGGVIGGSPSVSWAATPSGVRVTPYPMGAGAPSGCPRVDHESVGTYLITFDSTLTDSFSVSAPFSIMSASVSPMHTSVCRGTAEMVSSTVVRARVYDASDALINPDSVGLEVW